MRTIYCLLLALASLAGLVMAEGDVLFPYMYGLNYTEYDEAKKLGLKPYACKSEDEWNKMTTADFAKYKSIIIPDCICNTSLSTIKFLDNTKKVWSPAVTGNMVLIGTDPSYHSKWYKLAGASAMIRDSIGLASTGKNGTGMYFSLSCYYQSKAAPTAIEALSEIGDFKVRGNLTCLNKAHIVATDGSMTSLTDAMASNWNCSAHEVFTEYPTMGNGAFEPLAIALDTNGLGERIFADGTRGAPYIIARGATPLGCGDNVTDTKYNEECDYGKAVNGQPGSACSSSCKCLFGMISPGLCRQRATSSSSALLSSSTTFSSTSSIPLSTGTPANTSLSTSMPYTNSSTPQQTKSRKPPVTVTVWPSSRPPWIPTPSLYPTSGTASPSGNGSDPDAPTITVTYSLPPEPTSDIATDTGPETVIVTASGDPGTVATSPVSSASASESDADDGPGTVIVTASDTAAPSSASSSFLSSSPSNSDDTGGEPPETVIVTVSGSPGAGSPSSVLPTRSSSPSKPGDSSSEPPETVIVTASGSPGTDSPASTPPTSSGSPSNSDGSHGGPPETVIVTASAPSTTGSAPGTVPADSTEMGGPAVTVTAGVPESPTDGQSPSLSDTSSYPPGTDVPAWSSTGSLPQATLTVRPSGGEGGPMSGTASASGPETSGGSAPAGASSPASASGTTSGSPRPTVTVYPSGQTSARGGGGDGNGPGASETGSTKTLTVGGGSATAPGFPDASSSTGRGLGSTSWVGGMPGSSTAMSSNAASGGSETSRGSFETGTADPLGGSSTGAVGTASGPMVGTTASGFPGASGSGAAGSSGSAGGSPASSSLSGSAGGSPASPSLSGSAGPSDVPGPSSAFPSRLNTPSLTGSITTSTLTATSSTPSGSGASATGTASASPSPSQASGTALSSAGTSYSFENGGSAISSTQGGGSGGAAGTTGSNLPASSSSSSASTSSPPTTDEDCEPSSAATATTPGVSPPSPTSSECGTWVGIEIIHIIELVEICPEGSTVTETKTEHLSTLTRSICATPTPSHPCYPCIFGTPSASDDNFTVIVTSCPSAPKQTVTVTIQTCNTCTTTTYVGTVPGHTPGG
ncbi:hypothetical protein QBC36DRAFT_156122, partial [Triangularia setosa]